MVEYSIMRQREDDDERREVLASPDFTNFKYQHTKVGETVEEKEFADMWEAIHYWESKVDEFMAPYKGKHICYKTS